MDLDITIKLYLSVRGRRDRDYVVVLFTITSAIGAYHNWCCVFDSRPRRGVQHYVIKFVSDLRQVDGFLRVFRFPPPVYTVHEWFKITVFVLLESK
jgi:hypothetical protein